MAPELMLPDLTTATDPDLVALAVLFHRYEARPAFFGEVAAPILIELARRRGAGELPGRRAVLEAVADLTDGELDRVLSLCGHMRRLEPAPAVFVAVVGAVADALADERNRRGRLYRAVGEMMTERAARRRTEGR